MLGLPASVKAPALAATGGCATYSTLSSDKSYLVIKAKEVKFVKEAIACDVSPVTMFSIYFLIEILLKSKQSNTRVLTQLLVLTQFMKGEVFA